MASFSLSPRPLTSSSPTWGPSSTPLPPQFTSLPYAPFSPTDRLGRAADFTQTSAWKASRRSQSGANEEFQYKVDSETSEFQLVDTAKKQQQPGHATGWKKRSQLVNRRKQGHDRSRFGGNKVDNSSADAPKKDHRNQPQRNKWAKARAKAWGKGGNRNWGNRVDRQSSVRIDPAWELKEEFDLPQLLKFKANPPTVEDLAWAGHLDTYDAAYDKLSTRSARPLRRDDSVGFYSVSTTDDPVIESYAVKAEGNVYATSDIVAHLMTAGRTVYPWDVVVQKLPDGSLFFDKREASNFDQVTVSETSNDPPKDDEDDPDSVNSPDRLGLEAMVVNQNYTQQILHPNGSGRVTLQHPNPFFDASDSPGMRPAAVGYRYRKFSLSGDINLVCRTELHGVVPKKKGAKADAARQYMTAYALNEWDASKSGGIDFRSKVDGQRGAVLATELKNNAAKLSRWSAQSVLAGADVMKLGYVSRTDKRLNTSHEVLATSQFEPRAFAAQINLSVQNMWGVFAMLVGLVRKQQDGKYVILRDPNKPVVRLYAVPMEFNEDTESEEDSSDEEDEEEDK
eukprot:CAMPEP_0182458768 /NCGR_PEP_ID=MMETSP1319-20130603/4027_1 /TAXON_ID=172717 /ORGANISM="Bolidomonas pacifica, Strain RCC208" /LENGTH=565 /DNA_ID=CAMNT_0024657515 /DNA_START=67 /DNA_END=1764 /DNA_ORIENTATION=+